MQSLKYTLKSHALKGLTNDGTIRQYKKHLEQFATWAKETHRVRLASDVTDSCALTQEYSNYLIKSGYSPDTIHTYLAPVAKGFGLSMSDIAKPKRTASVISKTRQADKNLQGQRELAADKNAQVVEAAKVIGIRRDELSKLTGDCLVKDYAGNLCVFVRRGKGGKTQMQRILPKDESFVQQLFDGIGAKQRCLNQRIYRIKYPSISFAEVKHKKLMTIILA